MKSSAKKLTEAAPSPAPRQVRPGENRPPHKSKTLSTGARYVKIALAGIALLIVGLAYFQFLSLAATLGGLFLIGAIAFYGFLLKPTLDMDFDVSPSNIELSQILEELWD